MFCPDCGSEVAEGRKFCGKCGGQIHAAAGSVDTAPVAVPEETAAPVPRRPASLRQKFVYALVALLAVLGGVGWWWFHRPAPAYKVQDPGIYPFQGLSADGKTLKFGFIDADGKVLIQPEWDASAGASVLGQSVSFSEGLCGVMKDGKWGYIDTGGHLAIPAQFDSAGHLSVGSFIEGLARVNLGNQVGFINKTGQYAINPQFYEAGDFHDGLAAVRTDDGWGFINKAGTFVIKPHFQPVDIDGFSDGLAGACLGGKCGYIDRGGSFVIKPQFSFVDVFSEGMAAVQINGKSGYINTSGKIVINPQFDKVTRFSSGLAVVSVSGHQGAINKQGKYVVNPGQYNIQLMEGDLQPVTSSDGIGLLSRDGKWAVKPSKALAGIPMIIGKVFYGVIGGQLFPISLSGKVLAGPYKGSMIDTLAQDIENEQSAIQSMRTLTNEEFSYSNAYPAKGFAASLDKLGPATGTPDENHAGLIDAALATGTKDGYQFAISIPAGTSTGGTNFNYFLVAKPAVGHAGRTYCADSSGTIHNAVQEEECTVKSPIAVNQVPANNGDSASALFLGGIAWRFYDVVGGQWQVRDPQPNIFIRTADGLKLNGVGYRGTVGILTAQPIQLDGKKIQIKWKADGAGDYMGVEPSLVFFDVPPLNPAILPGIPLSEHGFTTHNSWEGSTVIRDGSWYYTTVVVQPDSLSSVTAEGNYSDQGGRVIHRTVKPRTSRLALGGLWLSVVDFYKGDAVSMTVGEVTIV